MNAALGMAVALDELRTSLEELAFDSKAGELTIGVRVFADGLEVADVNGSFVGRMEMAIVCGDARQNQVPGEWHHLAGCGILCALGRVH